MSEQLGRYEILEELGRGGFAVVHRAQDTELNRSVALKELHPSFLNDADWIRRFKRKAQTIAQLNHPRIVTIYDVLDTANRLFIVMRLVDGPSLEKLLEQEGPLPWSQALDIITTVAEALDYAHARDILHRDLKPANILLDTERGPQLSDFGQAKLASEGGSSVTAAGAIVGTPNYIAPEIWEGQGSSKQSDIYALGCILYEMLAGEKLFGGDSPPAVMMAHFNPSPLPNRWPNDMPSGVTQVLATALARESNDRYATAGEMIKALTNRGEHALAESPHSDEELERDAGSRWSESADIPVQLPSFLEAEAETAEVDRVVLVDRESELAQLGSFLESAVAGRGQVVFVTGEAGQGKTSLLQEFVLRAQKAHPNLIVASGICDVYTGIGDPYLPLRDVMSMLTGDVESQWAAGTISRDHALRLWHLIPQAVQALVEHGPDLIETIVSAKALTSRATAYATAKADQLDRIQELTAHLTGPGTGQEPDQGRLFEEYMAVLAALTSQQPLLLVLEDLHWADLSSISLLSHLGRRMTEHRILIAAAYRPEDIAQGRDNKRHPLERILSEFKRQFGDVWISLDQATSTRGRAFIDAFLDSEANRLGEEFRQELARHTGGHPLFTVELLRDMQDRGDLVQDEQSRWVVEPNLNWEAFPTRVEGVIERRISRLETELREALTVASVEGEEFTAEVIAQVRKIEKRSLIRRLSSELGQQHRLVQEQGILRVGSRRLSQYRFRHNLFQKYLYQSLASGLTVH